MPVRETTFESLKSIQMETNFARILVVTEVGPRIASFGKNEGRNLLFWDSLQRLKRGQWLLYGGHRLWLTRPHADETEEAYFPDNNPCEVQFTQSEVRVNGPIDPASGIQKLLTLQIVSDGIFSIVNTVRNCSDMLWSGGIWSLTATNPGGSSIYGVPLGDGTEWDAFTIVVPKKWGGTHTSQVNDPQISFTENCMVVRPAGVESKRMIQAPQGVIGMTDHEEQISFVKRSNYDPRLLYPLNANVAFYIAPGNQMVEMEFMGPQQTLKPGEEMHLVEQWELTDPVEWC